MTPSLCFHWPYYNLPWGRPQAPGGKSAFPFSPGCGLIRTGTFIRGEWRCCPIC
ncbi:hypothetical protein HMPREF0239_04179 [Clostridium sp. ATCC BAA-442]|nr:hypothetical protein HMPREF0239_04179 [Clostridium sp. ATCC BAA-442]